MLRFFRRVDTRAFPRTVIYNFIKYKISSDPQSSFTIVNVKNISAGGVLFISKTELQKNATLDITVNFPGLEPIDVKAEVVRSKRTNRGDYEIGAYFVAIDESKKKELARRIDFIIKKIASKSFLGRLKKLIGKRG